MKTFTDLHAWQSGMRLTKEIYLLTKTFPKSEQYGLVSQLRRASTSIIANIAEGFSRRTSADKAHKYTISRGECSECTALLLIAIEMEYLSQEESKDALSYGEETGKLLTGLIRAHVERGPTTYAQSPTP
jgi:four helix bundle protein